MTSLLTDIELICAECQKALELVGKATSAPWLSEDVSGKNRKECEWIGLNLTMPLCLAK